MGADTRSWEPEEILTKLEHEHGLAAPRMVKAFKQRLDDRYSGSAVTIHWGGSKVRKDKYATLCPYLEYGQVFYRLPVCFRVDGKVEVPFWGLKRVPGPWKNLSGAHETIRTPFYEEEKLCELRDRLNEIPGIHLKPDTLPKRWSTFDLFLLEGKGALDKLVGVFDWYVDEIVAGSRSLVDEDIEVTVESDLDSLRAEEEYFEGTKKQRFVNHYERDKKLRAAAVEYHGVACKACGFNFEKEYGERGQGFIEVHHLRPVSTLEGKTKVDPERDMTVLCSNCHRMVHRKKDHVLAPEELETLMKK